MNPTISVIIPLYNKRETVTRALQSVFAQTVLPEEILIVNDGSTDGSELIVTEINHPLVVLLHQPNSGVSVARNNGISVAKGEWIAFLDADDEWEPEFLKTMQMLTRTYPQTQVVASAYLLQNHLGSKTNILLNKIPFDGKTGQLTNYFEVASCSHPPLWTSAVMAQKEALQSIGGFPVGIKSGEDLLTWARLAVKYKIAYSLEPVAVFIQDAAHTYEDKPNRLPDLSDPVGKELRKLLHSVNPETRSDFRKYLSHWHKMRASVYLRLGFFFQSIRECLLSLRFNPLNTKIYIYLLMAFLPGGGRRGMFKRFGG